MAGGKGPAENETPGRTLGGGWVPIPDPTTLTTESVERATEVFRRELKALRETLETRLDANDQQRDLMWSELHSWPVQLESLLGDRSREFQGDLTSAQKLIEQRLDGMDKAIALAASELTKFGSLIRGEWEQRVRAEREYIMAQIEMTGRVMNERFTAVDGRFAESKIAVDAAFAAAKEAVTQQNRSNDRAIAVAQAGTKEQITALSTVTDAGLKGLEDKITDARDRITSIESLTRGIKEATGEQRMTRGEFSQTMVIAIMILSALIAVGSIIAFIVKK